MPDEYSEALTVPVRQGSSRSVAEYDPRCGSATGPSGGAPSGAYLLSLRMGSRDRQSSPITATNESAVGVILFACSEPWLVQKSWNEVAHLFAGVPDPKWGHHGHEHLEQFWNTHTSEPRSSSSSSSLIVLPPELNRSSSTTTKTSPSQSITALGYLPRFPL